MMQPVNDHTNSLICLKIEMLFSILRHERFNVTPEGYASLLMVATRLNADNLNQIAQKLCPIVATNEREQTRFYEIIQLLENKTAADIINFVDQIEITPPTPSILDEPLINNNPPSFFKKNRKFLLITGVLLIVGIFSLVWYRYEIKKRALVVFASHVDKRVTVIQKNDTLRLQASDYIPPTADTSRLTFIWDFGDGKIIQGFQATHVYKELDSAIVKMSVSSNYYHIDKVSDTLFVEVCKTIPKIQAFKFFDTPSVGKRMRIEAVIDSAAEVRYWQIDDSMLIGVLSPVIEYTFQNEGYHKILLVVFSDAPLCDGYRDTTIEVTNHLRRYSLSVTGTKQLPPPDKQIKNWVLVIVWIIAGCFTALLFLIWKKKKKVALLSKSGGFKKNVFEVPFQVNDLALIRPGKQLFKMLHLMRRRADEEISQLNIPLTLQRTIHNKGLSELVFTPRKKFQDYLVLIDASNPHGVFPYLFGYLSRLMNKMDVRVSAYYFDSQFIFRSLLQSGEQITPDQLINNHANSLLMILGDGELFFYLLLPMLKEKYRSFLNTWESRALITPLARKDWGLREKELSKYFLISSADEYDLLRLIENVHAVPEKQYVGALQYGQLDRNADLKNIEEAFSKLDGSFKEQWLCALATYPKFRWELVPVFGQVLAKLYGIDAGISYEEVLAICRIPWLIIGNIPASMRLELLKKLELKNEIAIRQELIKLLEQARLSGQGFYYDSELEDQLLINKFILFAHDKVLFEQYAEEAVRFRKMWEEGRVLDVSVRKYLENDRNEKWKTPVRSKGRSVQLAKYFGLSKFNAVFYRAIAGCIILLLAAGLSGYMSSLEQPAGIFFKGLFTAAPNQQVTVRYKLVKDVQGCIDLDSTYMYDVEEYVKRISIGEFLNGDFMIDTSEYPIQYNEDSGTIAAQIPLHLFFEKDSPAYLTLRFGNPFLVEKKILLSDLYTNGTIAITCVAVNDTMNSVPADSTGNVRKPGRRVTTKVVIPNPPPVNVDSQPNVKTQDDLIQRSDTVSRKSKLTPSLTAYDVLQNIQVLGKARDYDNKTKRYLNVNYSLFGGYILDSIKAVRYTLPGNRSSQTSTTPSNNFAYAGLQKTGVDSVYVQVFLRNGDSSGRELIEVIYDIKPRIYLSYQVADSAEIQDLIMQLKYQRYEVKASSVAKVPQTYVGYYFIKDKTEADQLLNVIMSTVSGVSKGTITFIKKGTARPQHFDIGIRTNPKYKKY
ncbi:MULTISPECIES: PKD domain-containing protein [Niastella]|uniref:PKD domain-containing protein n=1 Tax=Niastella soli TaxID=2821487 RepID=A0ABS3Z5K3_9BACT|nr:hypothetical protein [Niastella soli]MBO9205446.1 hypothetical protein [Niastella soli]